MGELHWEWLPLSVGFTVLDLAIAGLLVYGLVRLVRWAWRRW